MDFSLVVALIVNFVIIIMPFFIIACLVSCFTIRPAYQKPHF